MPHPVHKQHFSFGSILRMDRSHEMLKSGTTTLGENHFAASPTCLKGEVHVVVIYNVKYGDGNAQML